MSSATRRQAPRLARPAARYWKGKAPKGVDLAAAQSDSDEDQEGQQEARPEPGDEAVGEFVGSDDEEEELVPATRTTAKKSMNLALKDVSISKEGKVIVAGREESGKTTLEQDGEYCVVCHANDCAQVSSSLRI
jgi:microfibrillar-associated protein 1